MKDRGQYGDGLNWQKSGNYIHLILAPLIPSFNERLEGCTMCWALSSVLQLTKRNKSLISSSLQMGGTEPCDANMQAPRQEMRASNSSNFVPGTAGKSEPEANHLGPAHSRMGAAKCSHSGPWILKLFLLLSLVISPSQHLKTEMNLRDHWTQLSITWVSNWKRVVGVPSECPTSCGVWAETLPTASSPASLGMDQELTCFSPSSFQINDPVSSWFLSRNPLNVDTLSCSYLGS